MQKPKPNPVGAREDKCRVSSGCAREINCTFFAGGIGNPNGADTPPSLP